MRDQCRHTETHLVAVLQLPVDWVRLRAWRDREQRLDVLAHDHHLRAGQLLDERVSFLMIAVRVRAEQDLDVRELKAERGNRLLDRAHVALVGAVDQDVPFGNWRSETR